MEAFIGEIRLFAFTFAPKGWVACQGQLFRSGRTRRCSRCWEQHMVATAAKRLRSQTCRALRRSPKALGVSAFKECFPLGIRSCTGSKPARQLGEVNAKRVIVVQTLTREQQCPHFQQ